MIRDILSRLVTRLPERGADVMSTPTVGRVHAVIPVSEPRFSRLAVESITVHSHLRPLTLSIRATRGLLLGGVDVATDGCAVPPFHYCPHGCPSNGMLWGGVATDP